MEIYYLIEICGVRHVSKACTCRLYHIFEFFGSDLSTNTFTSSPSALHSAHKAVSRSKMTTQASSSGATNLQSIIYTNDGGNEPKLSVLDQLLVPHEKKYIPIPDVEAAWSVIRLMQIRGEDVYWIYEYSIGVDTSHL